MHHVIRPAIATLATMVVLAASTTSSASSSGTLHFNGDLSTGDLSQWPDKDGMNLSANPPGVSVVSTPAGWAAKVVVDPSFLSGSPSGPSTTMWEPGFYSNPWQQKGADTWFHARYLFPDGTNGTYPGKFTPMPTAGFGADWDVLMEWHSAPGAGYSTHVGIYNGRGRPHLVLHVVGNHAHSVFVEANRVQTKACNVRLRRPCPQKPKPCKRASAGNRKRCRRARPPASLLPLKFNHWYDILVHVVYSTDPRVGRIDWYVDGKLRFSDNIATLNIASDGSTPGVAFENGLYRSGGSSHIDTVYIQGIRVGSSRGSVGG